MCESKVEVWNRTVGMGPSYMYFNKSTNSKCTGTKKKKCTGDSAEFIYMWTNQGWSNQIKMCTYSTEK